jgi:hypothetical protein
MKKNDFRPSPFAPLNVAKKLIIYLSIIIAFGSNNTLYAQPPALGCTNFAVYMVKNPSLACGTTGCNLVSYDVFLRTSGLGIHTPVDFINVNFNAFQFALKLTSNATPRYSTIDRTCISVIHSGATASADDDIASFFIENSENEPLTMAWSASLNNYEVRLFSIVVDGYPGETVNFEEESFLMQLPNPSGGFPAFINCNDTEFIPPANHIFSVGSLNTLTLRFGNYDPNTSTIPIFFENSATSNRNIAYVDFSVKVTATGAMTPPGLTVLNAAQVPIGNGSEYNFRVRNTGNPLVVVPKKANGVNGSVQIGVLTVPNPIPSNKITTFTACLGGPTVRMTNNTTCFGPILGACVSVNRGSETPCTDNIFSVKVVGIDQNATQCTPAANCGLLKVAIQLTWPSQYNGVTLPATLNIERFKIGLDFLMSSGLTLSSTLDPCTNFPCTPTNSPLACTNNANCAKVIGNHFEYCLAPITSVPVVNGSVIVLDFIGTKGCVEGYTLTDLSIEAVNVGGLQLSTSCIPTIAPPFGFPVCNPEVSGAIKDELGAYTSEKIEIKKNNGGCPNILIDMPGSGIPAAYSSCVCVANSAYTVTPISYNNDWLNGVSTFDLLTIQKHILGIVPLPTPYKMIAADVNKSGTITILDNVDLRKLILGVNQTLLPANNSWRYVDASYVFPDPTNPFASIFPEQRTITAPASGADFVSIKIGDVNDSHVARGQQMGKPQVLTAAIPPQAEGGYLTVPVTYEGSQALSAVQLGLKFNPALLELVGTSQGSLEGVTADCFGLTDAAAGKIRFVWFDAQNEVHPVAGQPLFYLTFRVKAALPEAGAVLSLDAAGLESHAWEDDGKTYPLELQAAAVAERNDAAAVQGFALRAAPNPFTDVLRLSIHADRAEKVAVWVFDGFGVRKHYRDVLLQPGDNSVEIGADPAWSNGVYMVQVRQGKRKAQAVVIKQ